MNKISTSPIGIKTLYRPMKIVQLYLIGVIVLYVLGPMEWRTVKPFLLYMFLFISQGLLYLGYATTMNRCYLEDKNFEQIMESNHVLIVGHSAVLQYLKAFITINLILTCMYLLRDTGLSNFSITQIIDNLQKGFINADSQYFSSLNTEIKFGGSFLAPIITLMSPLTWPVIPLSLVYYKELSRINKIFTILTIFFEAARWISTGTNKGVIDLILIFITVILIKQWQKKYESLAGKVRQKLKRFRTIAIIILLLVIGLSAFQNNISSRLHENYNTISLNTNATSVNLKAPLMIMCPKRLQPFMVYITAYISQGYYGLSLALGEAIVPMLGVGNSYFLIQNFEDLLGLDLFQYTYQARIAYKGWIPGLNWHSAYTQLANDITFPGVLILMYFIGKYFAIVSYKTIVYKDPIATVLFCLLLLGFFYLPCNNQILSFPTTFMSFWGLNAFWFYRVKMKKRWDRSSSLFGIKLSSKVQTSPYEPKHI